MNEFIRLNVAFVPSDEMVDLAMETVSSISNLSEYNFLLDNKNYLPHITIYSPELPIKNLDKIKEAVSSIHFELLEFRFKNIIKSKIFGVEFIRTSEIVQVHNEIIQRLNKFREGRTRSKYLADEYIKKLSTHEIENIEEFGFPRVRDSFYPHLSLGAFKKDVNMEVLEIIEKMWKEETFGIDDLGIFEMGEWGTCINKIN